MYTALLDKYEQLNEQPAALGKSIPFICFTDNPDLKSETWQIKLISPIFPGDPIRSQREIKIRPHVYLPEFEHSLYIDNSVLLKEVYPSLLQSFDSNIGFAISHHSFRDTVLAEYLRVAWLGLDSLERVWGQLNDYYAVYPALLSEQPYWGGMLLRSHHNPIVCQMQDIWAAHVHRYSRRDQLSINYALKAVGLVPQTMPLVENNNMSACHTWPITQDRKKINVIVRYLSRAMLVGDLKMIVEQEMIRQKISRSFLRAALSWMLSPPVAKPLRECLKYIWRNITWASSNTNGS